MIGQVIGNIQQNEWKPQPFWRFEPFPVFLYQDQIKNGIDRVTTVNTFDYRSMFGQWQQQSINWNIGINWIKLSMIIIHHNPHSSRWHLLFRNESKSRASDGQTFQCSTFPDPTKPIGITDDRQQLGQRWPKRHPKLPSPGLDSSGCSPTHQFGRGGILDL